MARKQLRTLKEVWKDGLWPETGIGGPDPEQSKRHWAIAEVLCCIPGEDYERLKSLTASGETATRRALTATKFEWFIPDYETQGMFYPFPATIEEGTTPPYAKVLYLSPTLELSAWDIVLAVVAHELAHIVLCHSLWPEDEKEYEEALFRRLCEWGFEKEAKKHRAVNKWRASRERA